ncbi:hypothetical protein M0802_008939 [Mischocyttarus mexicanus]|nr:hypothetical protein M0802_008939 [Mischocyttarus mexicanus]
MTGYVWCKTMKRINAGEHHREENLGIMISLTGPKILYRRIVNSFVKNHVYMEPLQLNVLNNDKLPPDLPSNGQESKIDSKEEESIPDSKEEESISVSKEEEIISDSKEEESISNSKEEESTSNSKEDVDAV